MNWSVYKHTFPNGKVYIGITNQIPKKRWKNGFGYSDQKVFKEIVKFGWKNITHEILFENLTKCEAEDIERKLIKENESTNSHRGFNRSNGTGARKGSHTRHKIFQMDVNGQIVNVFDNLKEANSATGIPIVNISAATRGLKQDSNGWIWKRE